MKNLNLKLLFSRYPEFWILLVVSLVLFPFRTLIAGSGQLALSDVGSIWTYKPVFLATLGLIIFMIPGMALVSILGIDGDWWERLVLGFVGSLATVGVFSQIGATTHTSIDFVFYSFIALSTILVAGAVVRIVFFPPSRNGNSDEPRDHVPSWMWAILLVMIGIVLVFAFNAPLDGDEADSQAYIQNDRYDAHMMTEEPKWNGGFPVSPRFFFDTWLTDQAMISRITGQNPADQYPEIRLAMTLLTLAAFYTFARRITNRRSAAVLSTIAWTVYLLASDRGTVAGYEVVVRPDLDKVVAGFIVVPVGVGIMKTLFDGGRRRDWLWLVASSLAAMFVHPIATALLGLSVAGWGLLELITQPNRRQTFWRLLLAAAILAFALGPDVKAVFFPGKGANPNAVIVATNLTDTRDPSLDEELRGTLSMERIFVLDNGQYIMHPRLIVQWFFIPAFAGLPILFTQLRRSRGARMLFGMLVLVPAVLLFPPTANLIGTFVSPWIFYRLHWPIALAAVVTVGWGLWWVYDRLRVGGLPRIKLALPGYAVGVAGIAVWLLFMVLQSSYIRTNFWYLNDTKFSDKANSCFWMDDLLRPFQKLAPTPAMVLADQSVNNCLIGWAPYAGVMEWRVNNVVRPYIALRQEQEGWNRLFDARYFMNTDVVDERLIQIIQKWNIKFVVTPTRGGLDTEMRHLPGMFQALYTAQHREVFRVVSVDPASPIVQANSLLQGLKWSDAAAAFDKLQSSPDANTRFLAKIGLGTAYQQLGRLDDALTVFGQAASSTNGLVAESKSEADPIARQAAIYTVRRQYDRAIAAMQEAIKRNPDIISYQAALGALHYVTHDMPQATAAFEKVAAEIADPGSATYHRVMAEGWLALGESDRSIAEYKAGLDIVDSENFYTGLGNAYVQGKYYDQALAITNTMENRDPWDTFVHRGRGGLDAINGNWQQAANEFALALRFNPLTRGGYDDWTGAIEVQKGTPTAIQALQNSIGYRALHAGDALLPMSRLLAGIGQFDKAKQDLSRAVEWDGFQSEYYLEQADIAFTLGDKLTATQGYQKVLGLDDTTLSAYMRLADLALMDGEVGTEEGYILRGIQTNPNDPNPNLKLAAFFSKQAKPDLAETQYQAALDKYPHRDQVLVSLGQYRQDRGEFDAALQNYNAAISLRPVDHQAYLALGDLYRTQGQLVQAMGAITKAVQLAPGLPGPHAAAASLYAQEGNTNSAVRELNLAVQLDPGFKLGYDGLAAWYISQGKTNEAQDVFRALQTQFPQSAGGYLGLAALAERRGDFAGADATYRQALEQIAPSQSAGTLLARAGLHARQGANDQALQEIQLAIKDEPSHQEGYTALSDWYRTRGDYANALNALKQGLSIFPGSAGLNSQLASLQLEQGQIDEARQIYDKYLALYPGATGMAVSKADLSAALGHTEDAVAQLIPVQQHWSGLPDLVAELARLQHENGQPQDGLKTLSQLTQLAPGGARTWLDLGAANVDLGQFDDAEKAFTKATTLWPGDATTWTALAEFQLLRNVPDKAAAALDKAIKADQKLVRPHLVLADLQDRAGQEDQALAELQLAANLNHRDDTPLLALGGLSEKMNKFDDAQKYEDEALATDPTDPRAYAARSGLYLRIGQADQARQTLEQATKVAFGKCGTYQNLGNFFSSRGEFTSAEADFSKALSLAGCSSSGHVALGSMYQIQAKPDAAIAEFTKAIAAQPADAQPYVSLAQAYVNQNRVDDAVATYAQAVSKVPASSLLYRSNAQTLILQSNLQEGFDLLVKAANLRPANVGDSLALGHAYELIAQFSNAESNFQQAAKLDVNQPDPHLALGRLYTRLARFDEALSEDKKAVDLSPGSSTAYTQLGRFYESRNQYDLAMANYQTGFQVDQNHAESLLALGQLFAKLGRLDDAERTYKQALANQNAGVTPPIDTSQAPGEINAPVSVRALIGLGELYLAKGLQPKAEAAFRDAVRVAPDNAKGYVRLAEFYYSQNRLPEAMSQAQAAIKAAPASSGAYVALGRYYQAQLDWKSAEQAYTKASQVLPIDPSGHLRLGDLYQIEGREQDSLAQYEAATKAAPASVDAFIALGGGQQFNAQWDQAEKAYLQAILLAPGEPSGYLSLGGFYSDRGRFADALAQLKQAVQVAPASPGTYLALGDFHQSQVNWAGAEQAFKQAIAVSPVDPQAYIHLGRLNSVMARPDDALVQLQTAAKMAPGSSGAQVALGEWYESQVNWSAAEAAYNKALALVPMDAPTHLKLGGLYENNAQSAAALDQYQTAAKLAPASPDAYNRIGDWYESQGKPKAAAYNYRQAIQIAPTEPRSYVNLSALDRLQGDTKDALAQLQAAAQAAPASPLPQAAQGDLFKSQLKWSEAEKAFRQATSLAPTYAQGYVDLADFHDLQGDPSTAVKDLNSGIAMAPADPLVSIRMGDELQLLGRPNEALALFQSAVKVAPANAQSNVSLGRWYDNQANFAAAEHAFNQAVMAAPWDALGYDALSRFYSRRGRFDEAEALLKLGRSRKPGNVNLMLSLGSFYLGRAKPDQALSLDQTAVAQIPGSILAQVSQAQHLASQLQFDKAEQIFTATIKLAPGSIEPYVALGNYQLGRENWDAASKAYQNALAIEPINRFAFIGLVEVNLRQDKPKDALKQAQTWARLAPPGDMAAQNTLGGVQRVYGDLASSSAAYQNVRKLFPGNMESAVGLADTYRAQARFDDAINLLNGVLQILPNDVLALHSRAAARQALGQMSAALDDYQKASTMNPTSSDAYTALAHYWVANGQPQQGVQLYQKAIAMEPTAAKPYADLYGLYRDLKDFNDALTYAQQAVKFIPDDLRARLELAEVYKFKPDETAAFTTLQDALPLFPNQLDIIWTEMGEVHSFFGNDQYAIGAFHNAEMINPKFVLPYLGEGDVYLHKLDNFQQALALYQQAAGIDGIDPLPYQRIVGAYAKQTTTSRTLGTPVACRGPSTSQDTQAAKQACADAIKQSVQDAKQAGFFQDCTQSGLSGEVVVERDRRHPGWNAFFPTCYFTRNGLDPSVLAQYQATASAQPNSVPAQIGLAMMYQGWNMYDEAIATWQHVLSLDPANAVAYRLISFDYSLKETGRTKSAYAMGQAAAFGADDQSVDDRFAHLYSDHLTAPHDGDVLTGNVTITGTATGSNSGASYPFSFYKVEVGSGNDPQDWALLNQSSTPVTEGILATWDTSTLQNGIYSLRLVVVDKSGNYRPYDKIIIRVAHK